ncbi:MAG: RluA family pseudouridine synthase [Alistipes sp.]|nr:RluA family pseudouridine synthase [Alistipes sp.]
MFGKKDIIYEDNHILVVNKRAGDLVQTDPEGTTALEDEIKKFIQRRDDKPGDVFLGVVHRIDRPVSGAVLFAKTSKALVRLNRMIKDREVKKLYWAIVEELPDPAEGTLRHHIVKDSRTNRSKALSKPQAGSKEAVLEYRHIGSSANYHLLEIDLKTGRHHQIRAQLSKAGSPIRGNLKYGAKRSMPGGGISLHSRILSFLHPVRKEPVEITAPLPTDDNLWKFFSDLD